VLGAAKKNPRKIKNLIGDRGFLLEVAALIKASEKSTVVLLKQAKNLVSDHGKAYIKSTYDLWTFTKICIP
jgi:hypothetical protein